MLMFNALLSVLSCGRERVVLERFSFVATDTSSVFQQTHERFLVEYDSSAMGVFVKSIDGKASTKTAYWLFFVNSQPAKAGSHALYPAIGDTIEWRLISGY